MVTPGSTRNILEARSAGYEKDAEKISEDSGHFSQIKDPALGLAEDEAQWWGEACFERYQPLRTQEEL